jgi:hypothetical protein
LELPNNQLDNLNLFNGSSNNAIASADAHNRRTRSQANIAVGRNWISNNPLTNNRLLIRSKTNNIKVNLSIRPLLKKAFGKCALCNTRRELSSWDSNLDGRICQDCEQFPEGAEIALVAATFKGEIYGSL